VTLQSRNITTDIAQSAPAHQKIDTGKMTILNALSCKSCMIAFTKHDRHEPKICPCGHTFCKSCLLRLPNPTKCPECYKPVTGNIDDLPLNFALIDVLSCISSVSAPLVAAVAVSSDNKKKSIEELRRELAEAEREIAAK
jgi:hypothetical protein